jgi:hypothetical protein
MHAPRRRDAQRTAARTVAVPSADALDELSLVTGTASSWLAFSLEGVPIGAPSRTIECVRTASDVLADIESLVNAWCDRRCLRALRAILQGWPLASGLTDDWANLLDALEEVRAFAGPELADGERERVEDAIHEVGRIVYRH